MPPTPGCAQPAKPTPCHSPVPFLPEDGAAPPEVAPALESSGNRGHGIHLTGRWDTTTTRPHTTPGKSLLLGQPAPSLDSLSEPLIAPGNCREAWEHAPVQELQLPREPSQPSGHSPAQPEGRGTPASLLSSPPGACIGAPLCPGLLLGLAPSRKCICPAAGPQSGAKLLPGHRRSAWILT